MTILAINPGAKYLGFAVFRGPELRDWGIKIMKGKSSGLKYRRMTKILTEMIDRYGPDTLAIKRIAPCRSSAGLDRLGEIILAFSEKKGLNVYRYGIKQLEAFFPREGRSNKRKMAEMITLDYPVLHGEYIREKSNKNSYHLRMFEAVALGAVCFNDLDRSEE